MKGSIATTAVCVVLFGLPAVAGAAGSPGNPTPSQTAISHVGPACSAVGSHSGILNGAPGNTSSPGFNNLLGVGTVFGCTGP